MIFSLTLLITKTFSVMTLRMTTLSISTGSITILKIVCWAECHYAEWHDFEMMGVVAPMTLLQRQASQY